MVPTTTGRARGSSPGGRPVGRARAPHRLTATTVVDDPGPWRRSHGRGDWGGHLLRCRWQAEAQRSQQ